jgi:hypothetical protein
MAREILRGGDGVPPLLVSDHGSREREVDAEARAKLDAEVDAALAVISADAEVRRWAPRIPLGELAESACAIGALAHEQREAPQREAAALNELEADVRAEIKALAAASPSPVIRYGRPVSPAVLAYERAQLDARHPQVSPSPRCGSCMSCRTGGSFPCTRW